MKTKHILYN